MCLVLSSLHALGLVGPPAAACRALAAVCSLESLCARLFERDLASEDPLRARQLRTFTSLRRQCIGYSGIAEEDDDDKKAQGAHHTAAGELRAFAARVRDMSRARLAQLAAHEGRPALLCWLSVSAGGYPVHYLDFNGHTALMLAASLDWPRTVAAASTFCRLDQQHAGGHGTALHMAAFTGAVRATKELCRLKAHLELQNGTFGQTPLHVACSRNHAQVVRVLLEAGALPEARDNDGFTPRRVALYKHSHEALQALAAA